MKMKKFLAGVLALAMAGSLTACGGAATPEMPDATTVAADGADTDAADGSDDSADTSADSSEGGNSLSDLYGDETIQLTVYSQLANYSGKLTGWFAEVMKREFNVEMTIIPESDGMFDTRMESGNLGDIVIFGSNGDNYQRAAKGGLLFDWNEDDILTDYGSYIKENMPYAIENNMQFNDSFGAGNKLFGFGHNVATSPEDHEAFFYTMVLRWDRFMLLVYPERIIIDDLY